MGRVDQRPAATLGKDLAGTAHDAAAFSLIDGSGGQQRAPRIDDLDASIHEAPGNEQIQRRAAVAHRAHDPSGDALQQDLGLAGVDRRSV